jgi:hypothetical protein
MESVKNGRDVETRGDLVGGFLATTANSMGVSHTAMIALLVSCIEEVQERNATTDDEKVTDGLQIAFFRQVRTHF